MVNPPYLDPNGLEELWVSEGEFHHFFDLRQLFAAAADIIVSHLIQSLFFLLLKQDDTLTQPHKNIILTNEMLIKEWNPMHFFPKLTAPSDYL